jgi:hypothetical protein
MGFLILGEFTAIASLNCHGDGRGFAFVAQIAQNWQCGGDP